MVSPHCREGALATSSLAAEAAGPEVYSRLPAFSGSRERSVALEEAVSLADGAAVAEGVCVLPLDVPFAERLAPANSVMQQTPTRKRIAPLALSTAVQTANAPPGRR